MVESWLFRVWGHVQGVGFRESVVREARSRGLAGWVRNRLDGSVELQIQGSRQQLDAMRGWLREGDHPALVERVDATPLPAPFHRFDRFDRLPTP
jgi:acylphosphatase